MIFEANPKEIMTAARVLNSFDTRSENEKMLSNIYISVLNKYKNQVRLSTANLEVGISLIRDCNIISEGNITVNGKSFYNVVKLLTKSKGLFYKENNELNVTSGVTKIRFVKVKENEFFPFPLIEKVRFYKLDLDIIISMLKRHIDSISDEMLNNSLNGLLIEVDYLGLDNSMIFISSNGERLTYVREIMRTKLPDNFRPIILPKKGIFELLQMLKTEKNGRNNIVNFGFTQTQLIICSGKGIMYLQLLGENYPNYKDMIPKSSRITISLKKKDLLEGIRRVSVFNVGNTNLIEVSVRNNMLSLSSKFSENGEILDVYSSVPNLVSIIHYFNANVLYNAVDVLPGSEIIIKLTNSDEPMLLIDKFNLNYKCVVIPLIGSIFEENE